MTLSPAAAPSQPPSLLRRALAAASDAIIPSLAELVAARAQHLLERRRSRELPAGTRALPRSHQAR
ncbi:MAG: hypothetical protein J2P34_10830 [Actinobacteria bacterium]|nr:hypothetical protein [Actinomycetota bacterium]